MQDAGLGGSDDSTVLAWAADQGRVLLTHDVATMPRHALERVRLGLPMPGVIAVQQRASISRIVTSTLGTADAIALEPCCVRLGFGA